MQRLIQLDFERSKHRNASLSTWVGWPFRVACLLGLALSLPATAQAKDINMIAVNADCDTVSIRQAATSQELEDPEKVDWIALDRKQREYAGQALLPEHQVKEPEQDTVTGCAIKSEATDITAAVEDDAAELTEIERVAWAQRSGDATASEPEETKEAGSTPAAAQETPEQDMFDALASSEISLVLRVALIVILAFLCIAMAFGLSFLSKIALGLIRRRRVCMIPVSLLANGKEVQGHITILGLNCSRFVPDGKDECDFLQRLLDAPEPYFFDLAVGELSMPVFIDGLRGSFTPCAFDKRLTVKQQEALLAYSKVSPQIGQLISVPHDVAKHRVHIKARAAAEEAAGGDDIALGKVPHLAT